MSSPWAPSFLDLIRRMSNTVATPWNLANSASSTPPQPAVRVAAPAVATGPAVTPASGPPAGQVPGTPTPVAPLIPKNNQRDRTPTLSIAGDAFMPGVLGQQGDSAQPDELMKLFGGLTPITPSSSEEEMMQMQMEILKNALDAAKSMPQEQKFQEPREAMPRLHALLGGWVNGARAVNPDSPSGRAASIYDAKQASDKADLDKQRALFYQGQGIDQENAKNRLNGLLTAAGLAGEGTKLAREAASPRGFKTANGIPLSASDLIDIYKIDQQKGNLDEPLSPEITKAFNLPAGATHRDLGAMLSLQADQARTAAISAKDANTQALQTTVHDQADTIKRFTAQQAAINNWNRSRAELMKMMPKRPSDQATGLPDMTKPAYTADELAQMAEQILGPQPSLDGNNDATNPLLSEEALQRAMRNMLGARAPVGR